MYSFKTIGKDNQQIAEIISDQQIINSVEDGLDLLGNLYYQNIDKIVLQLHHFAPAFFDLKTKQMGELLQKFANYNMRLVIVGDIDMYTSTSKSFNDFVVESNRGNQVHFVSNFQIN